MSAGGFNSRPVAATSPGPFSRTLAKPGAAWLLVPVVAFVAIMFVLPLVRLVIVSFTDAPTPLAYYARFLEQPVYLRSLTNTLEIAVAVAAVCLVLGYPTALALISSGPRLRTLLAVLIVLPYFIAALVRTYAVMVLLGTHGPINNLLVSLGVAEEPLRLLFTRGAVVFALSMVLLPMMVLPVYSVMTRIDPALPRAAQALGASPTAAFWRVYFPQTTPGALAGLILVFVMALGFYITPALVGGAQDRVLSQDIAAQAKLLTSEGFSEALSVILLAVTIGILGLASRFLRFELIWGMAASTDIADTELDQARPSGTGDRRLGPRLLRRLADGLAWPALRAMDRIPLWLAGAVPRTVGLIVVLVMVAPILIVVSLSFTSSDLLSFPPTGLSLRWYVAYLTSEPWVSATLTSLVLGVLTAGISLVLGTLAALGLARSRIRHKGVVVGFLLSPLIVPGVVAALSLYWVLIRLDLNGSIPVLVAAHSLVAVPVVILIVAAVYQTFNERIELAAQSLGASKLQAFRFVTLPAIRPGLVVAAFFAFLSSFDELIYTLFIRGPRTVTLPVKLWGDLNYGLNPILAVVSSIEILMVVAALLVAYLAIGGVGPLKRRRDGAAE